MYFTGIYKVCKDFKSAIELRELQMENMELRIKVAYIHRDHK